MVSDISKPPSIMVSAADRDFRTENHFVADDTCAESCN